MFLDNLCIIATMYNAMEKNWGLKVKELKERAELTQMELAEKAKVGRSHLSRIELGHYEDPSSEILNKLANGFGITPNELRIKLYNIVTPSGCKTRTF